MGDRTNNHYNLGQAEEQNFKVPNLNMSLNTQPTLQLGHTASAYVSPTSSHNKQLFGCRSCNRVFFSSQALGGHMNAHRKETKVVFNKYKNKQPRTGPYPVSVPSFYTLGLVGPHALSGSGPASRDKAKLEPRCEDDESEFRVPNLHQGVPLDVSNNWPGSFRTNDQQYSPADESQELDLDLRL